MNKTTIKNHMEHQATASSSAEMQKISSRVWKFMWAFIRRQPLKMFFLILCPIIWALNESFFPYFIKKIINTIAHVHGDRALVLHLVMPFIIAMLSLFTLMAITQRLERVVGMYTIPYMKAQMRETLYDYVRLHSHNYFMDNFAGDIANKVQSLPESCQRILEMIMFSSLGMIALVVFSFFVLWHASHLFAGVMLLWIFCHFSVVYFMMRRGNEFSKIHADAVSTLSGKIVDCISNIQNVRLFARSKYERQYLDSYQQDEIKKDQHFSWHGVRMGVALSILTLVFVATMLFALVEQWMHYHITIGDFSLVSMIMLNLLGMMWFMSFELTRLARESGKVRSALQLINVPHAIVDQQQATDIIVQRGEIVFDQVDFNYNPNAAVFAKLSVSIKPGQKVGLVGFSGSGKTTFVNLIMRFYDINQGQIRIDGQNIADVRQDSLREQISIIPQDPALFHRTLSDNIRYGRLDASDAEVEQASRDAHCHEFISQLPEGYATKVGERGIKLSGGQRQRIAIARGILKNAPILILDEATSSLDTVTEKHIQSSLEQLMHGKTTLVVAHRLSTLTHMDRIIVFKQGKIVEDGDINTLLKHKQHFYKLWSLQQDGILPDKQAD